MSFYAGMAIVLTTACTVSAQAEQPFTLDSASARALFQPSRSTFTWEDRFRWIERSTLGPKNLAAGLFVAGIQTWRNEPETHGPHWDGYGKRYASRLAAGATSDAIEAGFGGFWAEDPRYYRAAGQPVKARVGHVVKMAFFTYNKAGGYRPAYARYIAVPGGILVSNTWRPDSPSTVGNVSLHVGLGFVSRIVGNAFSEFMPDVLNRGQDRTSSSRDGR